MNLAERMKEELDLVESMLPKVTWEAQDMGTATVDDPTAKSYLGTAPGWRITVVSFDIAAQGFPPGSRGYDGAAAHDATIVHLTRELAERAFKLAEAT